MGNTEVEAEQGDAQKTVPPDMNSLATENVSFCRHCLKNKAGEAAQVGFLRNPDSRRFPMNRLRCPAFAG